MTQQKAESYDPTQLTPENIRNVCILAHVDHGKTSIADSLLSLNGLVSKRAVGSTRFLDDRPDEQLRGITMKSSAVSLVDVTSINEKKVPVILNLVDTPGHIDFSNEVTAAIRICDGAIIVVDVVEGVCAQTKEVMKQAYSEKLKMLLIVNKIDRLVVDLAQDPKTMFQSILRIIEDCNAYLSSLSYLELGSSVEEFFSPELGNVIFASAVDGWGFTLKQVAQMFMKAIDVDSNDDLVNKLWDFDCFVNFKDKRLRQGANEKSKACLFVQLVTSTLHYIYKSVVVDKNADSLKLIIEKLQVEDVPQYRHFNDLRLKLKVILESWQSLSKCILAQCFTVLPSPLQIQDERVSYLINAEDTCNSVIQTYKNCAEDGPVIAYITKMVAINTNTLSNTQIFMPKPRDSLKEQTVEEIPTDVCEATVDILALIRIFSGKIFAGQELFLLSYDSEPTKIVIQDVFILLGREYKRVRSMTAGYICGITSIQLQNMNLSTATLSSVPDMLPIIEQAGMEPIVCNVVTPLDPNDLGRLQSALNMLQQSDSGVKYILSNTGEYLLMTAGDVHLQKCLEDMRLKFGDVKFSVSPPIYSLRETVENTSDNDHDITILAIPEILVKFMENHRLALKFSKEPHKVFKAFDFSTCEKPWSLLDCKNILSVNDTNILINCSGNNESIQILTSAFNACCSAGPLCEEPLSTCAFIVKQVDFSATNNAQQTNALIQQIRTNFREAVLKQNPVLLEPVFSTNIQTDVQSLGKLYSEVHKRNGKVVEACDVDDKNKTYVVKALIPAMESEGFVNDIRKISSGGANPSLNFSHYQIVGADPIKAGAIDDDEEEETYTRANKLKNQVRRRKGLPVDDHIVVHAEKQRTLKK